MTKHRYLALLWLCPSLGLLYPAPAGAADTLDQSQIVFTTADVVHTSAQHGQVFTAGLYGNLDRVSLYLENYYPSPPAGAVLTISVQTVIGGLPSGKQIGSGTIPLSAIPAPGYRDWVDVSIRGALVHAGTQYALVLQTSNAFNAAVWWWYAPSVCPPAALPCYAGGQAALNDGTAWRIRDTEFTFKTYVIPDVLDQSQHAWDGNDIEYGDNGSQLGQTFTAGLSGVLDRVRLLLANSTVTGPLEAYIETVTGGRPSGIVIGQGSIPGSSIPGPWSWVTIGISGAVVTAGTQYALVLHVGSGMYDWGFSWGYKYTGGDMLYNGVPGRVGADAVFETYVATPVASAPPPPPPATSTPCSSGVCPAVSGSVTPPDSTARVTSNVQFQELPDGTVHGILNFNDSRTGNFVLQGCTTDSAACRLTVTTIACTDTHAITVAGTYTPKGETAGYYRLTLSGARGGIGTFTLTADDYTYTLTHEGSVDVTCPPGAGVVAGQR